MMLSFLDLLTIQQCIGRLMPLLSPSSDAAKMYCTFLVPEEEIRCIFDDIG